MAAEPQLADDAYGNPIPVLRPSGTNQTIAVTTTSQATPDPVNAATRVVRLVATSNCHVSIGTTPTATTNDLFLPAGVVEYFRVVPGIDKVAAIRVSTDGALYVEEME